MWDHINPEDLFKPRTWGPPMGWESENFQNPTSPTRYVYKPKWDNMVDRSPEHNVSQKGNHTEEFPDKKTERIALEVTGEGVLVIRGKINGYTGQMEPTTVSLYTWDEIKFDSELGQTITPTR